MPAPHDYVQLALASTRRAFVAAMPYTFIVSDRSAKQNFHLQGPGLNKKTGTKQVGRLSFTTNLAKGTYKYSSDANPKLKGTFKVV